MSTLASQVENMFDFIERSPDPYHASAAVCERLTDAGYTEITEYAVPKSGKYFIRRGNAVAAFRCGKAAAGFMITASHSDSPALRLKRDADRTSAGYSTIAAERYGGMLHSSWLDRPLRLSGRAFIKTESGVRPLLFDSEDAAALIPSVAVHLNRKANTEFIVDPARDLVPLFGEAGDSVTDYIASLCRTDKDSLVSFDGILSCMDEPRTFGKCGKYIASPRLDDLMCVHTCLEGFLTADDSDAVPVYCLYDGEEIGSRLRDGAASDLLPTVLKMIAGDERHYREMLTNTVLISADNGHAVHPKHPELSDSTEVRLGGGVVIKRSASHSYMTEGDSEAVVCELCRRAGVPVQHFANRSDLPGGSTLGAIAITGLPVMCADIGAAELAMHSAVETAGSADVAHLTSFAKEFYSSSVHVENGEIKITKGGYRND